MGKSPNTWGMQVEMISVRALGATGLVLSGSKRSSCLGDMSLVFCVAASSGLKQWLSVSFRSTWIGHPNSVSNSAVPHAQDGEHLHVLIPCCAW